MPRYYRSIAPLAGALFCAFLCACNGGSTLTEPPAATPGAATPAPLPDVSAMIKRMTTQDGSKDFTADMRMTSVDENGKRDQIEFKVKRKYSGDGASTFLTVLAPHEESDKAFLAIEQADKPTVAFSYLAGLKRLTKLNSDKQLSFRGAKVTVQELLWMQLDQYMHDAGERVNEGNEQLIKVEFKEKPYLGLAFPRIVGFFREKDRQPLRFDLFGANDELQKTVKIEEAKQIQNRQTITRVAIDDLGQRLKLELETRKIEYDSGLPDRIFTEDYLKSFISGASRKLDQSR